MSVSNIEKLFFTTEESKQEVKVFLNVSKGFETYTQSGFTITRQNYHAVLDFIQNYSINQPKETI